MLRMIYLRETDSVAIKQETGWAPVPVWTGAGNLATLLPGFDPRTIQHVTRYTDWSILALLAPFNWHNILILFVKGVSLWQTYAEVDFISLSIRV
jgi:hypothetical protein